MAHMKTLSPSREIRLRAARSMFFDLMDGFGIGVDPKRYRAMEKAAWRCIERELKATKLDRRYLGPEEELEKLP